MFQVALNYSGCEAAEVKTDKSKHTASTKRLTITIINSLALLRGSRGLHKLGIILIRKL